MQHFKKLPVFFIALLSGCASMKVEVPPQVDFCFLEKENDQPYFYRCVKPNGFLYNVTLEDALVFGFEGMKTNEFSSLRNYIVRLQSNLSACQIKDATE